MISNNRCLGLIISFVLLSGCSITPSKSSVEDVIIKQLGTRYYRVTDVVIGHIQKIPSGEKQERGSTACMVSVPSLTIEFIMGMGEPWNYKKGFHLTLNNVRIRMKKSIDRKGEWVITNVSGIPFL